jgi:hypothetical protein
MNYKGYCITSDGEVYSRFGNKLKPQRAGRNGEYRSVPIFRKPVYIHRIVAELYIPNPENKPTVNHIDGDKTNNAVSNLEWATYSENNQHALDTGLREPARPPHVWGDDHASNKVNSADVYHMYRLQWAGMGVCAIAEVTGISRAQASRILNGRNWGHIYKQLK